VKYRSSSCESTAEETSADESEEEELILPVQILMSLNHREVIQSLF